MKFKKTFLLLFASLFLAGCNTTTPSEPSTPVEPSEPSEPTEPETPSEPDAPSEPDVPTVEDVNVIVLAGQSNAEGNSNFAQLETYCNDHNESFEQYVRGFEDVKITFHNHYYHGVSYLYSNRDEPLEANFVNVKVGQGKTYGWSGPELGMAKYFHDTIDSDKPLYIIKFASGGTGFSGDPSWKVNGGLLYERLIKYVDNGFEALKDQGLSPKFRAFCWMQGEQDSYNDANANAYKDNLKTMVNSIRTRYQNYAEDNNSTNIGVVDGFISDSGTWAKYQTINNAKRSLSEELDNYYVIDTTKTGLDLKIKSDTKYGGGDAYHYTMDSMLTLGKAFAQTILNNNLLKYQTGTYSDNLTDFSTDDSINRPNSFKYEAESAIWDSRKGIIFESASSASNGKAVSYFREHNVPYLRFIVNSSKAEENALLSLSLASAMELSTGGVTITELPHQLYKQNRLTVNGEPVRISGTLAKRVDNNDWHGFREYKAYVNLKEGVNIIDFHHDKNLTYTMLEERINIDYLKIDTASAVLSKLNNNIYEAEKAQMSGGAKLTSINANKPSNGLSVTGLDVINSKLTIPFTSSAANKAGLNISFGLTEKFEDLSTYLDISLNGSNVPYSNVRLPECSIDYTSGSHWYDAYIGEINLLEGENELVLKAKKAGLSVNIDLINLYTASTIYLPTTGETTSYKFEAENTNYFTPYGSVGARNEDNSNNPSGGSYLGGFSYAVGGVDFKFNVSQDATITLKLCLGLTEAFNFGECYDLYLTNSQYTTRTKLNDFDIAIPKYTANQWFQWTEVVIGTIDVKQGENILRIDHPIGSPYYGANLDYVIIDSSVAIS